eukprot:CAMPEP_0185732172 /NCGR_PEP_ID=MMETSP1171-20130828/15241_1 /TAXON_ID=374046 /ORGANISM="Helicotheca tamensis, Strain CCMP826" /LENGTH=472 /DNA_ID=CAMNT_0028401593 /DNA_START=55 /DNA_END=1469 /DNA_ORIENTATION=-
MSSWLILFGITTTIIINTLTTATTAAAASSINNSNNYSCCPSPRTRMEMMTHETRDDMTTITKSTITTRRRRGLGSLSNVVTQKQHIHVVPPIAFLLPSSSFFPRKKNKLTQNRQLPFNIVVLQASASSPDSTTNSNNNKKNYTPTTTTTSTTRRDMLTISTHLFTCFTTSLALSSYEDYECANLKSGRSTLRPQTSSSSSSSIATKGLGRGKVDRINGLFDDEAYLYYKSTTSPSSVDDNGSDGSPPVITNMREIQSYNEIMEYHRNQRVKRWTPFTSSTTTPTTITEEQVKQATHQIYISLNTILQLKEMAINYEWDEMTFVLRQPVLNLDLECACEVLRGAKGLVGEEGRLEIGFDWGSCAWRHCGAQADAQEAIAELYNYVGLYEPYECLFVLDIIERSLRDIIMVVPVKYQKEEDWRGLRDYVQYQPVNPRDDGYRGDGIDSVDTSSIDEDYLEALTGLKSDLSSLS